MLYSKKIKAVTSVVGLCGFFLIASGCADSGNKTSEKPKAPWVMELHVVPTKLTINPDKFYAKPFTVRAQYSNARVKNVSKTVQWVSEDVDMLAVSQAGELVVTGQCEKAKCPVFLVGTDPVSGKSVRVTVNVKKRESADKQSKKKAVDNYLS